MKIDRIDVYPLEYPTVGYFKFFTTPRGATGRPAVMVKISADNGTVGWGQAVPAQRAPTEAGRTRWDRKRPAPAPAVARPGR